MIFINKIINLKLQTKFIYRFYLVYSFLFLLFCTVVRTEDSWKLGTTGTECVSCNVPTCEFFPSYKNSLQGWAWHETIHMLVELKRKSEERFPNLLVKVKKFTRTNDIKISWHMMFLKQNRVLWYMQDDNPLRARM